MVQIKTLMVSGENNHDWQRSTPFCKNLLEKTGKFTVDVTLNPKVTLADSELLHSYGLIFTDYNGPDWGEAAKASFIEAIGSGTGLVVLHAANNAFQDWPEYKQLLGLTFQDGTSGHGEFHEFEVAVADPEHPITRDLKYFKTWDELYHRTVPTAGINFRVLATAYSDPAKGGTGRDEPVMVVLEYGKGRVFHLLLGHVWPHDFNSGYKGFQMVAFENEYFQKCLIRGCEWAAAGQSNDKSINQ